MAGGKVIRVIRPGAGLEGEFANHKSEKEMEEMSDDDFDLVISNTGSLIDLENKVTEFVNSLTL